MRWRRNCWAPGKTHFYVFSSGWYFYPYCFLISIYLSLTAAGRQFYLPFRLMQNREQALGQFSWVAVRGRHPEFPFQTRWGCLVMYPACYSLEASSALSHPLDPKALPPGEQCFIPRHPQKNTHNMKFSVLWHFHPLPGAPWHVALTDKITNPL